MSFQIAGEQMHAARFLDVGVYTMYSCMGTNYNMQLQKAVGMMRDHCDLWGGHQKVLAESRYVITETGAQSVLKQWISHGVRRMLKLLVELSDTAELSTPYCTARNAALHNSKPDPHIAI